MSIEDDQVNDFFCFIGKNFASNISNARLNLNPSENITQSIFMEEISDNQVYNGINQLTNQKYDHLGISICFLKKFSFALLPFLAKLFNDIIDQVYFPSKMKYSRIIPLHKPGSLKEPGNFRPITLINTISKVFKKLLHQKM